MPRDGAAATAAFLDYRATINYDKDCLYSFILASIKNSCSYNISKDDVKDVLKVEINVACNFLLLGDIFPLVFFQ